MSPYTKAEVFASALFFSQKNGSGGVDSRPRVLRRLENIVATIVLASLGLGLLLIFIGRIAKNSYQLFSPRLPSAPAKKFDKFRLVEFLIKSAFAE